MIRLESDKMQKAIERAKQVRPRVRRLAERSYSVTGSRGDLYTVNFAVVNGMKLAECSCPATGMCFHISAAASINIAVHSCYSKPSDDRTAIITDINARWNRKHPRQPIGVALLKRFGVNRLESLADGFLKQIHKALT